MILSLRTFHLSAIVLLSLWSNVESSWWENAVIYQIYPRSFLDTDGNGIGDLKGITSKSKYLKDLGINGIWMNPIYPSPLKDFGYDIKDFKAIDPTFGTIEDLQELIKVFHKDGLKVLMDMVPNHSSDEHPWFISAKNGDKKYMDYYVWSDSVPNNWLSVMGGSAWQYCSKNRRYYYHAFLKEQPDLNYRNQELINEMLDVMTFWLDMDIDGFRVDAVPYLVEYRNNRLSELLIDGCTDKQSWSCLNHTFTASLPETFEVLGMFKNHIDAYNTAHGGDERIMVTEATYPPSQLHNYFSFNNVKTATMPFNFQLLSLNNQQNAGDLFNLIDQWFLYLPEGARSNWVLGNHDQNRITKKLGHNMGDAANMLNLLLPGTTFTYYGEELAMDDTPIRCKDIKDTSALRQGKTCAEKEMITRDPERSPMQWDDTPFAGFSSSSSWLPVNPDYYDVNVKSQSAANNSALQYYKELVKVKNDMKDFTQFNHKNVSEWVYSFMRSVPNTKDTYIVLINLNNEQESVDLKKLFSGYENATLVRAATTNSAKKISDSVNWDKSLVLRPYEGVVLYSSSSGSSSTSIVLPSALLIAVSLLSYISLSN